MKLREIEFGFVFASSGARGFFDQPYRFQQLVPLWKPEWTDTQFIGKTMTVMPRLGKMEMLPDGVTPLRLKPNCIHVNLITGNVLNAVGLSNPGARALFETGIWQQRRDNFGISFAAVSATPSEREEELKEFVALAPQYLQHFQGKVALHLNFGCPNTGVDNTNLVTEVHRALEISDRLHISIVLNFSPTVSSITLIECSKHPSCDALWPGNSIPWGDPAIDWKRLYHSTTSPLTRRGFDSPGGLSGPACLPIALSKVRISWEHGCKKPLIVCNGIRKPKDVRNAKLAQAAGIGLGSIAIVRPWLLTRVVREAYKCFGGKEP